MSYAIVRNEKLTRAKAQGICVHNDRKAKKHSNKDIDVTKSSLNYYLKKNELNYIKEFDKLKKQYGLKGQIRENSIIMCEMVFTSDTKFFETIGFEETKRYFNESYNFICNYKNLKEQNILSAVIHLDEGTPHMHLVYVPVIHTKDKEGNEIDKICCRDFWKGRDSYRNLQNAYYDYITSKGFKLERGLPKEETNREHYTIQEYKNITNFKQTKELLRDITLELPEVPNIKDIKKIMINRDEKIANEIIKPKDDLINKLHKENVSLYRELSKQTRMVTSVEKYQAERDKIIEDNRALNNKVQHLELEYKQKSKELDLKYDNRKKELEKEFEEKSFDIEYEYKNKFRELERENSKLYRIIDKFYETIDNFIHWICDKFSISEENTLIRDFQEETNTFIDAEKQLEHEEMEKDLELER